MERVFGPTHEEADIRSASRPALAAVAGELVTIGAGLTGDVGRLAYRRTKHVVDGVGTGLGLIRQGVHDLLLSRVPGLTGAVLDQLDLTALIRERVDLDALVTEVDVVAIAKDVIDAVDLPQIVRESSAAMASETVRGVRIRTVDADERVTQVVDRLLRRQVTGPTDHEG